MYAPQFLDGFMPGVVWHAHEMLWGFIATIAVGFLLTAAGTWTGINPLSGRPLAALTLLWLMARVGYLTQTLSGFAVAVACELAFFAWAAGALARVICVARSQRNYGIPVLVLSLGIADVLYLRAAWKGDYAVLLERFNIGLWCMAVIALLIARRVIPFFAMRAVPNLHIQMHTRSGQFQVGAVVLAIASGLLQLTTLAAGALVVAAVIGLAQFLAWRPWAVRHKPILWILYVGYAALSVGLLVAAAHSLGWIVRTAWPTHVLGVGGFSVLIIGMVTRTAMGHLGRPLQTDHSMVISYVLVIAAATLRLLALVPTAVSFMALQLATAMWMLAFAIYLWRFVPMMIRPRVDASPAPTVVSTNR